MESKQFRTVRRVVRGPWPMREAEPPPVRPRVIVVTHVGRPYRGAMWGDVRRRGAHGRRVVLSGPSLHAAVLLLCCLVLVAALNLGAALGWW